MSVQVNEVILIPIAKIRPNTWNPNVQDPAVFNALVDHIVDVGFTGSCAVRPLEPENREGEWEYELVDGEHRYKAALILQMPDLPCTVFPDWDQDKAMAETVAFNVLSGHLDPVKFTAMFNRLGQKYGEDVAKQMMSFADEALFNRTYRRVRETLPPDMQQKLDKSKSELKTIDDLSVVLHDMFRKYGHTIDHSYIFFRYGGKTHLMVQMEGDTKTLVDRIAERSAEEEVDINGLFSQVLKRGMKEWDSDGRPEPVH